MSAIDSTPASAPSEDGGPESPLAPSPARPFARSAFTHFRVTGAAPLLINSHNLDQIIMPRIFNPFPTSGSRTAGSCCYDGTGMRKSEIANRLARQSGVTNAEAADQLDRVVHQILSKLRSGKPAPFPGLGLFTPGPRGSFQFEREKRQPHGRK